MTDGFSWRSPYITPEEQEKIDAFIQDKLDRASAIAPHRVIGIEATPAEFMEGLGFVPLGDSTAPVEEERPCGKTEGTCCGGRCG